MVYVGQASHSSERRNEHFRKLKLNQHYNAHLQSAFNKYGVQSFYFEVLERRIPPDKVNDRERYWIARFNSHKNGFNKTIGGQNTSTHGAECSWNGIQYKTQADCARENGISVTTLKYRLKKGWTCNDDVAQKAHTYKARKPCEWNGISYNSHRECANANNVLENRMSMWLSKGYKSDSEVPSKRKSNNKGQ